MALLSPALPILRDSKNGRSWSRVTESFDNLKEGRNKVFILARSKALGLYLFSYLATKASLGYKPVFLAKIQISIFWVYVKYASVNMPLFYIQMVFKTKLKKFVIDKNCFIIM